MKNKVVYVIIGVILALVIGCIVLIASLNKQKESISSSEFKTMMEDKGFVMSDETGQFAEYDYVKQAYVAISSDYSYKIKFYELSNDEYANRFYNNNKEIFKSTKDNLAKETSVSINNYAKYTLEAEGKYKVVSRIDNTVVYLDVYLDSKDAVKDILDEIGY